MIRISQSSHWLPDNILRVMYSIDNKCFWCGKKTHYYGKVVRLPPDAATVEHLYTKSDWRRYVYVNRRWSSPVTISCNKCNQKRKNIILEDFANKIGKKLDINYEFIYY